MKKILSNIITSQSSDQNAINEDNYNDYLVDDVDDVENDMNQIENPFILNKNQVGIPEQTKEMIYGNPFKLVYAGIEFLSPISFDYTTRHGTFIGKRAVEPHYTFFATTTGNEILVSFDRTVNDIRAFIIGNIHSNGVRYTDIEFNPRSNIMAV